MIGRWGGRVDGQYGSTGITRNREGVKAELARLTGRLPRGMPVLPYCLDQVVAPPRATPLALRIAGDRRVLSGASMNLHSLVLVSVVTAALASLAIPAGPRTTTPGQRATARRVLVVTDMEGISGVNDGRMGSTAETDTAYYAAGLTRLHADVNATIAGLFDGGAAVVDVADTHGGGRNLQPARLDSPAHAGCGAFAGDQQRDAHGDRAHRVRIWNGGRAGNLRVRRRSSATGSSASHAVDRLRHRETSDRSESRRPTSRGGRSGASHRGETSGRVAVADESAQANNTNQGWAARHLPDEPSDRRISLLQASGHRVPR